MAAQRLSDAERAARYRRRHRETINARRREARRRDQREAWAALNHGSASCPTWPTWPPASSSRSKLKHKNAMPAGDDAGATETAQMIQTLHDLSRQMIRERTEPYQPAVHRAVLAAALLEIDAHLAGTPSDADTHDLRDALARFIERLPA